MNHETHHLASILIANMPQKLLQQKINVVMDKSRYLIVGFKHENLHLYSYIFTSSLQQTSCTYCSKFMVFGIISRIIGQDKKNIRRMFQKYNVVN